MKLLESQSTGDYYEHTHFEGDGPTKPDGLMIIIYLYHFIADVKRFSLFLSLTSEGALGSADPVSVQSRPAPMRPHGPGESHPKRGKNGTESPGRTIPVPPARPPCFIGLQGNQAWELIGAAGRIPYFVNAGGLGVSLFAISTYRPPLLAKVPNIISRSPWL